MTPFEWIALASLVISVLGTIGNEVGNAQQANRASQSAQKMQTLQKEVTARNKVLQSDIDALAAAISGANQLGATLDSRIAPKIHKSIAQMKQQMKDATHGIAHNNSLVNEGADLAAGGNPGGIVGMFTDAGYTKNIENIEKKVGEIQ